MRRFPFLASRYALVLLLGVNFALLGISIYLGLMSANQMKEIVKEDFNQQQLVLAKYTASLLEQDINFLKRELSTLNFSPSIQYLEPLSWANRMRATLASVREEGVVEILRVSPDGNRAYQMDSRGVDQITTGSFKDAPFLAWAALGRAFLAWRPRFGRSGRRRAAPLAGRSLAGASEAGGLARGTCHEQLREGSGNAQL